MKIKQLVRLSILFFTLSSTVSYAQEKKSAKLFLNYFKDNTKGSYIKAQVKYKEDKQYLPVKNIQLVLYKITNSENDDGETLVVTEKKDVSKTNEKGEAFFYLQDKKLNLVKQSYQITIENDKKFKDNSSEISFIDAKINTKIIQQDSLNVINVQLLDANDVPIPEQYLTVQLKKLFGNVKIGDKEMYETDDDGMISVEINERLYSKDGLLNFVIKLDDSDEYGTIIDNFTTDFGISMESKDTFDERTMWSTAKKAPLYILIIPNLILIAIWSILLMLIFNLYRIYKNS